MEYSQIRRQNTGSMAFSVGQNPLMKEAVIDILSKPDKQKLIGCIPPKPKGGEIFLFYTDDL